MTSTTEQHTGHDAGRPAASRVDSLALTICAWAGPVFAVALCVSAVGILRFVPPPREYFDAAELASFYADRSVGVRVGGIVWMFAAPTYFLWSLAVDRVMARTLPDGSVLRRIQRFGGYSTAYVAAGTGLGWCTAAFYGNRPGADPDLVQVVNDGTFLFFNLWLTFTLVQLLAMAAAWLSAGPGSLVPRWVAYLCLFDAASFFTVTIIPFVRTGPLSWHGAIAFYVLLGLFFAWLLVTSWQVLRAVRVINAEDRARPSAPAVPADR